MRQQQDEPGRFSICSRQAAVVQAFCLMAKRWFVSCCAAERRKPRS
ncbi:hypothetical protein GSO14_003732 [Salmonella enterica]|nr:hypothetical protein [Salmonella enterica]